MGEGNERGVLLIHFSPPALLPCFHPLRQSSSYLWDEMQGRTVWNWPHSDISLARKVFLQDSAEYVWELLFKTIHPFFWLLRPLPRGWSVLGNAQKERDLPNGKSLSQDDSSEVKRSSHPPSVPLNSVTSSPLSCKWMSWYECTITQPRFRISEVQYRAGLK